MAWLGRGCRHTAAPRTARRAARNGRPSVIVPVGPPTTHLGERRLACAAMWCESVRSVAILSTRGCCLRPPGQGREGGVGTANNERHALDQHRWERLLCAQSAFANRREPCRRCAPPRESDPRGRRCSACSERTITAPLLIQSPPSPAPLVASALGAVTTQLGSRGSVNKGLALLLPRSRRPPAGCAAVPTYHPDSGHACAIISRVVARHPPAAAPAAKGGRKSSREGGPTWP